jgi:septal ring factor EnvC (AmiA/AmiB activator)
LIRQIKHGRDGDSGAPAALKPSSAPRFATTVLAVSLAILGGGGMGFSVSSAALAQSDGTPNAPETVEGAVRQLDDVNAQLEREREVLEEIEAEIDDIRGDQDELNSRLVATAETVQQHEAAILNAEDRLTGFVGREKVLRDNLNAQRGTLASLLGALQRMGHRQPPAIVVAPQDALRSVRSAMLVGAVVPDLRSNTMALATDLQELVTLRTAAEQERTRRADALASLDADRVRLKALMDAKAESALAARERLLAARSRADDLATESENLEQLLSALRKAKEAPPVPPEDTQDTETARDIPDAERLQPASRFAALRGTLGFPVAGAVNRRYGSPDEFGGRTSGISMTTRAEAQVTSPTDGTIVYSGPFRSFGELLIIDVGDDYHIVLAGLGVIDVDVGQVVLAGEPIGRMGAIAFASASSRPDIPDRPILYIEFRKGGAAIDPSPWWSANQTGDEG